MDISNPDIAARTSTRGRRGIGLNTPPTGDEREHAGGGCEAFGNSCGITDPLPVDGTNPDGAGFTRPRSAFAQQIAVSSQDRATTMFVMPHINKSSAVGLVIVGLVVVVGVATVLHHNPLGAVDAPVLEWMVSHRSSGGITVIAGVTGLFGPAWVVTWTAIAAVALILFDRNAVRAMTVVASVAVAGALGGILKIVFDRTRPPFVDQAATFEASQSFPSGHVTGTTALVLALALAVTVGTTWRSRIVAIVIAMVVAGFAALTRLYLGLHWFSDILAGIAVGAAAAIAMPSVVVAVLVALGPRLPQRTRPYLDPPISLYPPITLGHSAEQPQEGRHSAPVA